MTDPCLTEGPLRVGIDGGATKTRLILTDSDGRILLEQTGPGCNPSHLGPEGARALIRRLLRDLVSGLPGIHHRIEMTRLFMAGDPLFWRGFATSLTGFGKVKADLDSIPVLQLACGSDSGLVIHGGTGSFVAARGPDGRSHYAGGLGWRIGDPGSAHDLGVHATRQALMVTDGWSPPNPVSTAVLEALGHTNRRDLLKRLYTANEPGALLAGLAPIVSGLAEGGCAEAIALIHDSVQPLVDLAAQVAEQIGLPSGFLCGLSGKLFNLSVAATIATGRMSQPDLAARTTRITDEPIEGVRRILAAL